MVDVLSGRKVKQKSGKGARLRGLLSGLNPAVFGAPAMLPALNSDVSRLSLIPTGDTRETGHAPPVYSRDRKEQEKYLAQRRLRGVSDLALGAGDLTNMVLNAGLRDVGYFAGAKPDNVYQFPMPSQSAANLATEATGTRIVPEETMPFDVRQRGANQQALMGMLPVGPEAVVGPALGILPPMARALKGGGKVAKTVEEILPEAGGLLAPIRAYHGSPYHFQKFDPAKLGTGEGGANAGRGINLTEDVGEAHTYINPSTRFGIGGEPVKAKGPGHVYEVDIGAGREQFVDIDAPLNKQPQDVQDAVREWSEKVDRGPERRLSHYLRENRDVEDRLAGLGYKGLTTDRVSGNRQYMVFDPGILNIRNAPEILPEPGGLLAPIRGYHGSPHSFAPEPGAPLGRFRDTAIGTGEGAQAYGRGHYLAESEGVARDYRDKLTMSPKVRLYDKSGQDITGQDVGITREIEDLAMARGKSMNEAIDAATGWRLAAQNNDLSSLSSEAQEVLKNRGVTSKHAGHMYEVNIAADPEHFLDWDKPLAEQHPVVQEQLRGLGTAQKNRPLAETDIGRDLYFKQSQGLSNESASERLKQAGIPGIKYLDQDSRSAGTGSRNFVVFDPKLISIVRKYGLTAAIGMGLISEEMAQQMKEQGEI